MNVAVRDHYRSENIVPRLLAALRAERGQDVTITPDTLAPLDHFHRGGLASTRKLAALLDPQRGDHILDIGCGIGGQARWIAREFGCRVTGIDLVPEYCRAAEELNNLTGVAAQVAVVEGDASSMPFEPASFDRAYSHSVAMNIADKCSFYREVYRVLKPGGTFVLFILGMGAGGPPYLPAPWANGPESSFLTSPDQTRADLLPAGLEVVVFRDVTVDAVEQQRQYLRRLEQQGPPALGWHVLMGPERSVVIQANAARSFDEGRLTEMEILVRRPPAPE